MLRKGGEREVITYPSLVDYVVITPFFIDSHHARTHRVISRHAAQFVLIARHELRGLMSEPEKLATYSIHQISVSTGVSSLVQSSLFLLDLRYAV